LRKKFPNLKNDPDEMFRTMSVTELIRLDTKMSKDSKCGKKITEKLQRNFEKSKSTTKVKSGHDNRHDKLHEARFLGGHTCGHSDIWLKAREQIGITGLEPIARYDVESLGISDKLNCNIWNILHNPGSRDLSIRLFAPEALKVARSSEDKESSLPKKDFEQVSDLRNALATLRTATQLIFPWNMTITTIEMFLSTVNFGERETVNKNTKLTFLCDFIDDILRRNAEAWDDRNPFWDFDKVSNKWVREIAIKFPRNSGNQKAENQNPKNNQAPKQQNSQAKTPSPSKPPFKKLMVPNGVCRRFNLNICPNQSDDTCIAPWDTTKVLKHVCCHEDVTTKAFCMKKHALPDHK
jgi:hypothetical protein